MNDLVVPARLSWDAWVGRVHELGTLRKKINWYVGDLLNYGIDTFGEKAWQEIEAAGYSEGALANLKYVAKKFPPDERSAELPWSVYQAIAPFHKKDRERLVTQALSGEINRAGIRALGAAARNGASSDPKVAQISPEGGLPARLDVVLDAFGEAAAGAVKLAVRKRRGEPCDGLLADALDDLIAKAMDLKARIRGI